MFTACVVLGYLYAFYVSFRSSRVELYVVGIYISPNIPKVISLMSPLSQRGELISESSCSSVWIEKLRIALTGITPAKN